MVQSIYLREIAITITLIAAVGGSVIACQRGSAHLPHVAVYKSPTCSCCTKWVRHLEEAGFRVESINLKNLDSFKDHKHVPADLRSCHTATVDGYVVEGHVPAEDIKRLLSNRPKISGLAVADMPIGSPGMESSDRSLHEDFDVMSFGDSGTRVFASHRARP